MVAGMPPCMPRYLVTTAVCALLAPAAAWGSLARAGGDKTVNPSAAATACAGRLGANPNAARVASLTSCVLRTERRQLGLGYHQDGAASVLVAAALRRFVGLSYLAHHDSQAASHVEDLAAAGARDAICSSKTPGTSRDEWTFADNKPPTAVTPIEVAGLAAKVLQGPGAVAGEANAVFAVAARRGQLFEHDAAHGVSLGIVAVTCP